MATRRPPDSTFSIQYGTKPFIWFEQSEGAAGKSYIGYLIRRKVTHVTFSPQNHVGPCVRYGNKYWKLREASGLLEFVQTCQTQGVYVGGDEKWWKRPIAFVLSDDKFVGWAPI